MLIGVPVMTSPSRPAHRPLHRRQHAYRDQQGDLITRAADIVAGLRVLRGIGGEQVFAARYRAESQRCGRRRAGGLGRVEAGGRAGPAARPAHGRGDLARRDASRSGEITVGQLVSFYGYAAFLIAAADLAEAADKMTKGMWPPAGWSGS